MENPSEDSLQTVAARAPITAQRRLNTDLQEQMPSPYLARALEAVDPEHINGSTDHNNNDMSVLQQHVAFFDIYKDGIIYPWDTYRGCDGRILAGIVVILLLYADDIVLLARCPSNLDKQLKLLKDFSASMGFRALGFNIPLSLLAAVVINVSLSYYTLPGWIPSLKFPLYIENIHRAKHGSDTESYDTEGRFDPTKFDAIFSKYAIKHQDKLTFWEIQSMMNANRNANDFLGWAVAEMEWVTLYAIAKNKHGLLEKESIRRLFDGSLFEELAKQNSSRKRC